MLRPNVNTPYLIAGCLAILGVLLLLISRDGFADLLIFQLALMLCAIGVILRFHACAKERWDKLPKWLRRTVKGSILSVSGGLLGLIPVGIYFLSSIYAKNAVAEALQMPAKDYPTTIHLLTAITCVAMWILFGASLLAVATIVAFIRIAYLVITREGASMLSLLSGLWRVERSSLDAFGWRQNKKGMYAIGDLAGTAFLLCLCLKGGVLGLPRSPQLVRWIAYRADYLPAGKYPGIEKFVDPSSARVVFHDNGVVSFAVPKGPDVDIVPKTLKP